MDHQFACVGADKKLIEKYGLPESVGQLSDYPGIVCNMHTQKEERRYRDNKHVIGIQTLNRNLAANMAEMQLEACLRGIGIALFPAFSAEAYLNSGELVGFFVNTRLLQK